MERLIRRMQSNIGRFRSDANALCRYYVRSVPDKRNRRYHNAESRSEPFTQSYRLRLCPPSLDARLVTHCAVLDGIARMADTSSPSLERRRADSRTIDEPQSTEGERSLIVRSRPQASGAWSWVRYPLVAAGVALSLSPLAFLWPGENPIDPTNYAERTRRVLKSIP